MHGLALSLSVDEAVTHVRDRSALEAAAARPRWYAKHVRGDLATQAAILAHGIAEAQVFIDGNKRTAWVALRTFLIINGHDLIATQEERAAWILDMSRGGTADQLAARIRNAFVRPRAD